MQSTERDSYTAEVDARISAPPPRTPEIMRSNPYEAAPGESPVADTHICYSYVDFGNKLADAMLKAFRLAASTVHAGCPLVTFPFTSDKHSLIRLQRQLYAKMRRSVRGNIIYLDTDVICNVKCDPFEGDFDIGLTDSGNTFPLMPFNAGVMFAKDTPGAQMFLDAIMEYSNNFPDSKDLWYIDQVGMGMAYVVLKDKIKIKIFPHAQYNFVPEVVAPTDAYFVHLKGDRKKWYVDFLRYAMERYGQRDATALPGKLLSMDEPMPDPEGLAGIKPNIEANLPLGLPAWGKTKVENGRVAIVGYGPSLLETWEQLKDFDGAIWTTSKAHDFLLSRGIAPTFHTDLDYREHKAHFNKLFSKSTQYILATQVHPKYLARFDGCGADIRLFHSDVPSGTPSPGYPRVAAQFDVGLQAAYMAARMGYVNQVWFGIDASLKNGETHAGAHEGIKAELIDILVADRIYTSSALLIRAALFGERMLCKYPFIRVKITGDGLIRPFLLERGKVRLAG